MDIKKIITDLADKFMKEQGERFGYLYARWQDEREFEDFAEYIEEMKKLMPAGCEFVKAMKRPFSMIVKHPTGCLIDFGVSGGYVKYRYQVPTRLLTPAPAAAPVKPAVTKSSGNPVADAAAKLKLTAKQVRAKLRRAGVNVSTTSLTAAQIIAKLS